MRKVENDSRPRFAVVGLALATVFGVGYVPFAPGTFGSIAGLVLWLLIPQSAAANAALIVVLFAIGSWSGTVAERHFGKTDPGPVVIDEVMGMLITQIGRASCRERVYVLV